MKILFLDVDGVLNGYPFLSQPEWSRADPLLISRLEAQREAGVETDGPKPLSMEWWGSMINPDCVARVNRIVDETGCKVVLSSSWRLRWEPAGFTEFIQQYGATFEISDRTTREHDKRGRQIIRWIREHVDSKVFWFCVLDDDIADMDAVSNHLVQTSMQRNGITDEEANAAIAMLGGAA